MKILERARQIILNPRAAWQVINGEAIDARQLFINYAAPLALVPAVCSMIGMTLFGLRMPAGNVIRAPFIEALLAGVAGYVLHLGGILVGAWLVKALAPLFNSKSDFGSVLKVVVYSMTPVWLVGIFSIVPGLGILAILGLYGIYLLALGLPAILGTPGNKVLWYVLAILVVGLVISFILSMIVVGAFYGPMFMRMMSA